VVDLYKIFILRLVKVTANPQVLVMLAIPEGLRLCPHRYLELNAFTKNKKQNKKISHKKTKYKPHKKSNSHMNSYKTNQTKKL